MIQNKERLFIFRTLIILLMILWTALYLVFGLINQIKFIWLGFFFGLLLTRFM